MENEITAHVAGKVTELAVSEGGSVNAGDPIAKIEAAGRPMTDAIGGASVARPQRRSAPTCRCRPGSCRCGAAGGWRKRWRYVGAFGDEVLVCAARVHVGPLVQNFWVVCDRESGEMWEKTRMLLPGRARRRVDRASRRRGGRGRARRHGRARLRARRGLAGPDRLRRSRPRRLPRLPALRHGGSGPRRSAPPRRASTCGRASAPTCRSRSTSASATAAGGSRPAAWRTSPPATTRTTRSGAGRRASAARPTAARSAGTSSRASTIRRSAPSGRSGSTASPPSPAPVGFDGLDAIDFDDGSRLAFAKEFERSKDENRLSSSTRYRQPFGTFTGTLPGGIELESGLGVMEFHDATW